MIFEADFFYNSFIMTYFLDVVSRFVFKQGLGICYVFLPLVWGFLHFV